MTVGEREVTFIKASAITPLAALWVWEERLPLGELALIGGAPALGKSTNAYDLIARLTKGTLPGDFVGTPKTAAVCAAEDSWEHTIVPRLIVAGADLDMVYRVNVTSTEGYGGGDLVLPEDLAALEILATTNDVGLILLDPLLSRLDARLDSHKDADVRRALEPLVVLAHQVGCSVLGVIHTNKSSGKDALSRIMASRAFGAVARSVLFCIQSNEDEDTKVFGVIKSNLGAVAKDSLSVSYTIEGADTGLTDPDNGKRIMAGRIVWGTVTGESIDGILADSERSGRGSTGTTLVEEAGEWLVSYLSKQVNHEEISATVIRDGEKAGHKKRNLQSALKDFGVRSDRRGFPGGTWWVLMPPPVAQSQNTDDGHD